MSRFSKVNIVEIRLYLIVFLLYTYFLIFFRKYNYSDALISSGIFSLIILRFLNYFLKSKFSKKIKRSIQYSFLLIIYFNSILGALIGTILIKSSIEWKVLIIQIFAIFVILPRHTIFSKRIFIEKHLIYLYNICKKIYLDLLFILIAFVFFNISNIFSNPCYELNEAATYFLLLSFFSVFWYLITFKINIENRNIKILLLKKWNKCIFSIIFFFIILIINIAAHRIEIELVFWLKGVICFSLF